MIEDAVEIFQAILEATDIEEEKYHLNPLQKFSNIFYVELEETVKFKEGLDGKSCQYCGQIFPVKKDKLNVVRVPIDSAYNTTQELLVESLSPQEQKDPRKCSNPDCEKPGTVEVEPTLATFPPILAIQLLRFSNTGIHNKRQISTTYKLRVQGVTYILKSITNHLNVHYTAYVKEGNQFIEYNDGQNPKRIENALAYSRKNYLMFYMRHNNPEVVEKTDQKWVKMATNIVETSGVVFRQEPGSNTTWYRKVGPFDGDVKNLLEKKNSAAKKARELRPHVLEAQKKGDKVILEKNQQFYAIAENDFLECLRQYNTMLSKQEQEEQQTFMKAIDEDRKGRFSHHTDTDETIPSTKHDSMPNAATHTTTTTSSGKETNLKSKPSEDDRQDQANKRQSNVRRKYDAPQHTPTTIAKPAPIPSPTSQSDATTKPQTHKTTTTKTIPVSSKYYDSDFECQKIESVLIKDWNSETWPRYW